MEKNNRLPYFNRSLRNDVAHTSDFFYIVDTPTERIRKVILYRHSSQSRTYLSFGFHKGKLVYYRWLSDNPKHDGQDEKILRIQRDENLAIVGYRDTMGNEWLREWDTHFVFDHNIERALELHGHLSRIYLQERDLLIRNEL